jgi:2-dehydropantoate 2-reductase
VAWIEPVLVSEQWHVLGVGAMGGLFACRLQSGGADVTLLAREDEQPTRELILKREQEQRFTFPQQNLSVGQQPIEHLLVCTKAWAVESAIESVAHRLSANSIVVLLCNGMGLAEAVAPLIGEAQLVAGSTTSGCRRSGNDELIVSGEGRTQLGTLDAKPAPTWSSLWRRSVPDFEWETDIRSVLLAKVALNAVINPLTALRGVTNGELIRPPLQAITEDVIEEVQSVLCAADAQGIAAALPAQVRAVCQSTAANHSSMRVDLDSGKRTEIDAIVGWLLSNLTPHPPPTPVLSELYHEVKERDRTVSRT